MDAVVRDVDRTDALTALPNRVVVLERIENALKRARANNDHRFAVLFVNGDRLNQVNVTRGPAAGDELLRSMAARVNAAVRQRDMVALSAHGERTAGRLGVDEFVIVLDAVFSIDVAALVVQRLVDALRKPYSIDGVLVHSPASVGVTLGAGAAVDADEVLQDASLAMREAKRAGGACYRVFEPLMKITACRRASLESELRRALQDGQLFFVYQPITDLGDGRVAGFEALVRWLHPQRGVVSPMEFIEIAEATDLIHPLGAYVLGTACHQFAQWQRQFEARAPQLLSVNLSRAQLQEGTRVGEVERALRLHGVPASCLQLEITESLAAESALIQQRLHELKALGVKLALDDFGTGYSSLASLHQWPVDVIKIDRSFVSQVTTSAHHRILIEATVMVARSLKMKTVAEGVETEEQAELLTAQKCDEAQGYLYARPMGGADATRWLAARTGLQCLPGDGAAAAGTSAAG